MSNSNSKASLFLMELIMSILFFSLSAAVCVQLFVKSHALSQQSLKLNYAVIAAESMAESFYSVNGDLETMLAVLDGSYLNANTNTVNIYYNARFERITINDFPYDCRYMLSGVLTERDGLLVLDISYIDYRGSETIYHIAPELYPSADTAEDPL